MIFFLHFLLLLGELWIQVQQNPIGPSDEVHGRNIQALQEIMKQYVCHLYIGLEVMESRLTKTQSALQTRSVEMCVTVM